MGTRKSIQRCDPAGFRRHFDVELARSQAMKALSKSLLALPFAAGLLSFGVQSPAQAALITGGLVNVELVNVNVLNNLANNLHVSVSNIPISVIVPVSVAANVCGIQAAVL